MGSVYSRRVFCEGSLSSGLGSKTESTEGVKYRIEKELDVKLRNAVTLEHSVCSEGKVRLLGRQGAE